MTGWCHCGPPCVNAPVAAAWLCYRCPTLRGGRTMADHEAPKGLHIDALRPRSGGSAELESAMVTLQSDVRSRVPARGRCGRSRSGREAGSNTGGIRRRSNRAAGSPGHGPPLARLATDPGRYGVVGERLPQTRFAFNQRGALHPALPRASPPRAASPLRLPAVLCYRQRQLPRVSTCASRNKGRYILTYKASLLSS